jgi:hypothetical protein
MTTNMFKTWEVATLKIYASQISGFYGGEYEGGLSSAILRREVSYINI